MRSLWSLVPVVVAACSSSGAPCDLSNAAPIERTSPSGSTTWPSGVHRVSGPITVPAGATLTIAACSRVEVAPDATILVRGSLVAEGTTSGPVDFVPASAGQPWGGIVLDPNGDAKLTNASLTLAGGSGDPTQSGTLGAGIFVHGVGGPPPPTPLTVDHVDIEQSSGVGVALVNAGFATGSTALTVSKSFGYPIYLGADVVDTIPDGTYTGNGADVIILQSAFFAAQDNQRPITRDTTFHDRGVPYCAGMKEPGEIVIGVPGSGSAPLVTIEPGVAIGFPKGTSVAGRIRVRGDSSSGTTVANGALRAVGTADKPIVFASCEPTPAAGDWIGLAFEGVDSRTRLEAVGIAYAGANSGVIGVCMNSQGTLDGDAALQVHFQKGAPAESFLVSSVIQDSAANAIFRGWNGPDIDFTAGNQFARIGWCVETIVPDNLNACPNTTCPTAP